VFPLLTCSWGWGPASRLGPTPFCPLAQLVEHGAVNAGVQGSSPWGTAVAIERLKQLIREPWRFEPSVFHHRHPAQSRLTSIDVVRLHAPQPCLRAPQPLGGSSTVEQRPPKPCQATHQSLTSGAEQTCQGGGVGRHAALRTLCPLEGVRVRVPPLALDE
jgi:hypothetical protein